MISLSLSNGAQYEATPTQVDVLPRFRVRWDDEISDYGYRSRTLSDRFTDPGFNAPAVLRFFDKPREDDGDYRVNLETPYNWQPALIARNNYDGDGVQRFKYWINSNTAQFNSNGWPKMAYLVMSGNVLQGERVGDWLRFVTLKQSDVLRAQAMTEATHPQYCHHFTCVTWDAANKVTKHINSTGTPRGAVLYWLVTKEGVGWIPYRMVAPL